jgi:flagellar assembly protein FliH
MVEIETLKLEAFDRGFKAGWDDAVKARSDEATQISTDLASNLRDLSFTFLEARADMLGALGPLIEDIVAKVLPVISADTLGPQLRDIILEQVQTGIATEITLAVCPDDQDKVTGILSDHPDLQVTLRSDPTLCAGQVFVRFADREQEINLDETLSQVRDAIKTFFTSDIREAADG